MARPWPSSPLDAAQRAFDLLTCPPAPLAFDGRGLPGAAAAAAAAGRAEDNPDRRPHPPPGPGHGVAGAGGPRPPGRTGLGARRCRLGDPGTAAGSRDAGAGWRGDTADLDGELLAGFVDRLRTVDLDGPRVQAAGRRRDPAVRRARSRVEDTDAVHVQGAWWLPPAQPWDHPDWVLARAVAAAVIDPDDHLLISATRLDGVPLQQVADRLGVSVTVAAGWGRRAEARLARHPASGELRVSRPDRGGDATRPGPLHGTPERNAA